jgi:hypothetical protein
MRWWPSQSHEQTRTEEIMKNTSCETLSGLNPLVRTSLAVIAVFAAIAAWTTQAADGGAAKTAAESNLRFTPWLKVYIPAAYSDAKMTDHGGWVQGSIPGLTASWAEWNEAGITLKKVHDIEEGELVFISKDKKENWPESVSVVYFTGVGYYIAGYSAATMADWNVEKSTVVQFDGEAKKFVERMALARMKDQKSLVNWLKYYIPAQHPGATIQDHGGWVQAKLPGGLVASWAQWNEAGITLKGVEAHALKDGRSIFISKDKKENWAEGPSAIRFDGAGYYITSYSSSAMSGWGVERSTVIQFDGDAKKFVEQLAKAWTAAN